MSKFTLKIDIRIKIWYFYRYGKISFKYRIYSHHSSERKMRNRQTDRQAER